MSPKSLVSYTETLCVSYKYTRYSNVTEWVTWALIHFQWKHLCITVRQPVQCMSQHSMQSSNRGGGRVEWGCHMQEVWKITEVRDILKYFITTLLKVEVRLEVKVQSLSILLKVYLHHICLYFFVVFISYTQNHKPCDFVKVHLHNVMLKIKT